MGRISVELAKGALCSSNEDPHAHFVESQRGSDFSIAEAFRLENENLPIAFGKPGQRSADLAPRSIERFVMGWGRRYDSHRKGAGQKPPPALPSRIHVAKQVHGHGDQPCLRRIGHRAPSIQLDERFLRKIGGEIGVLRDSIQNAIDPRELGVEQSHELVMERSCLLNQLVSLLLFPPRNNGRFAAHARNREPTPLVTEHVEPAASARCQNRQSSPKTSGASGRISISERAPVTGSFA